MNRFKAAVTVGIAASSMLLPLGGASAQSSALPDGVDKAIVSENCTACHGADVITAQRRTRDDWADVVNRMLAHGAALTEEQSTKAIAYLTTYLGKDQPTPGPVGSAAAPAAKPGPVAK